MNIDQEVSIVGTFLFVIGGLFYFMFRNEYLTSLFFIAVSYYLKCSRDVKKEVSKL